MILLALALAASPSPTSLFKDELTATSNVRLLADICPRPKPTPAPTPKPCKWDGLFATGDCGLISLAENAKEPIATFHEDGSIEYEKGVTPERVIRALLWQAAKINGYDQCTGKWK